MLSWTDLEAGVARAFGFVPTPTIDALVDVAALVAAADATRDHPVKRSETMEVLTLIRQLGRVRRRQMEGARARFVATATELSHGGQARAAILERIRKIADTPEEARLVMRMAHEVATADGISDAAEEGVLRELGDALGVDPDCCRPAA